MTFGRLRPALLAALLAVAGPLAAQSAPSVGQVDDYDALQRAVHRGELDALSGLLTAGADIESRDTAGRTPAIIAAFGSHDVALRG